ncbi:MAG: DNA-methyltransferase [Promethearchaeota archaeon]
MSQINPASIFYKNSKAKVEIINDDFIITQFVKENSIDLVVTSPPYNVNIRYGEFKDDISYEQYLEFTKLWMNKAFVLLKEDGRICLNIPLDKNKGGQQSVYADFVNIAKDIGYKYHSTIIWNEGNISRRTAWGSWMSASAPYVIAPVEIILVLYKEKWKKNRKGVSDIKRDEFIEWTNGLWTFSGESKKKIGHPAPYPLELPKRCIKLFSYVDDTVLDPFLGSGTTLLACVFYNRRGIGVEIDLDYCKLAKKRLLNEAKINQTRLL